MCFIGKGCGSVSTEYIRVRFLEVFSSILHDKNYTPSHWAGGFSSEVGQEIQRELLKIFHMIRMTEIQDKIGLKDLMITKAKTPCKLVYLNN